MLKKGYSEIRRTGCEWLIQPRESFPSPNTALLGAFCATLVSESHLPTLNPVHLICPGLPGYLLGIYLGG